MRELTALALAALLALPATAGDKEPPSVTVYPAEIELSTTRDRQSYVVQMVAPDGVTRDVTDEAKVEIPKNLVDRKGNVLAPKADGSGEMTVTVAGRVIRVPIAVKQASADRPISFKLDVMPVFMRAGCNTGACHGAARGAVQHTGGERFKAKTE